MCVHLCLPRLRCLLHKLHITSLFTYQYGGYQSRVKSAVNPCEERSALLWKQLQSSVLTVDMTFLKKFHKQEPASTKVNFWICWIFLFPPCRTCHQWLLDTSFIKNPRLKFSKAKEVLLKPKWLVALASQLIHSPQHSQISLSSKGPPRVVVVVFLALTEREVGFFFF